MNTTDHFTLNGSTNKIDFKTTYKIPTAGTADAVDWSGITSVPATWTTSQIPELAKTKISGLQNALDAKQTTINSTAGQIIIGNGNGATTTNPGLTFATNTLTTTNIVGNGSGITFLNVNNFSSGLLPIVRGGTGSSELLDQSILIGSGENPIATYSGFTYDVANTSLKSDRITGAIQYSEVVTNITDPVIYISSTPTTDT
jgi:hypothetical protein